MLNSNPKKTGNWFSERITGYRIYCTSHRHKFNILLIILSKNNEGDLVVILVPYLPRSIPVQWYWKCTEPCTKNCCHAANETTKFNGRIPPVTKQYSYQHTTSSEVYAIHSQSLRQQYRTVQTLQKTVSELLVYMHLVTMYLCNYTTFTY